MDHKHISRNTLTAGAHFGDVGESRQLAGLILTESTYAPQSKTPVHSHETASFTMVISGCYVEHFRRRAFECMPGRVLFRASREQHTDHMSKSGASCLMIELPQDWQTKMSEAGADISASHQFTPAADFVRQFHRELAMNDSATTLGIQALTLELICNVVREQNRTSATPLWLAQLRKRIDAEFTQKISLADLARDTGHHPAHVARAFRRRYGCSIGEYVRKCRVTHTCEQMRAGEPLSTVALNAGFSNQAHFSRVFRAVVGMTPKEYLALSGNYRTKMHRT